MLFKSLRNGNCDANCVISLEFYFDTKEFSPLSKEMIEDNVTECSRERESERERERERESEII